MLRARPPFSAQVRVQRTCSLRMTTSINSENTASTTKPGKKLPRCCLDCPISAGMVPPPRVSRSRHSAPVACADPKITTRTDAAANAQYRACFKSNFGSGSRLLELQSEGCEVDGLVLCVLILSARVEGESDADRDVLVR